MAKHWLTGEDDEADSPLKNIVSPTGPLQPLIGDPASRAALLQIGLNLMQPVEQGQTTGGALARGIGSGGDVEARLSKEEFERQKHEDEIDKSNQTLAIRQQEADACSKAQQNAATRGAATDRIALEQLRQQGRLSLQGNKNYHQAAIETYAATQKEMQSPLYDPKNPSPNSRAYGGKSIPEIEKMFREGDAAGGASTPQVGAGAIPPPAERVVGKTYPTPKGDLQWTGSGWVKP